MRIFRNTSLILLLGIGSFVMAQSGNDSGTPVISSFTGFTRTVVGTGSFDGSEPTMSPRFFRSGTPGDPCSTFSSGNFQYQTVEFHTDGSGSLTVNFDPGPCTTGIFVTFHSNSFNPASICDNFVWAFGSSTAFSETFAVPPGTDMVMVVSGVATAPGVVCGAYSYEIIGDAPAVSIPTLSSKALILLVAVFCALGVGYMVRRRKLA